MPQFDFGYWPGQIAWLLIIFAVLYGVMGRVLLPRVRGGIETRHQQITGGMEEARRLRDEAEAEAEGVRAQLAEARLRAQRTAADAKARAASASAARQSALEAELSSKLAEAEGRIRASRNEAMGQVSGIAGDTAAAIAEKLSGQAVSGAELQRALDTLGARAEG